MVTKLVVYSSLALRLVGAIPERISVWHRPSGQPLDGLVIGGGDDISPEHYGGELTNKVKPDEARDKLEIEWINWAITITTQPCTWYLSGGAAY